MLHSREYTKRRKGTALLALTSLLSALTVNVSDAAGLGRAEEFATKAPGTAAQSSKTGITGGAVIYKGLALAGGTIGTFNGPITSPLNGRLGGGSSPAKESDGDTPAKPEVKPAQSWTDQAEEPNSNIDKNSESAESDQQNCADTSAVTAAGAKASDGAQVESAEKTEKTDKAEAESGEKNDGASLAAVGSVSAQQRKATLKTGTSREVLHGSVRHEGSQSPLLEGSAQALPESTTIDFTSTCYLNSEVTQKGSEILVKVAHDVKGTGGVMVPGGWYAHGVVTEVQNQKHLGRDGYIEVQFDKLLSPDKQTEIPFETKFSTKDSLLKSVAKVTAIDAGYVSVGAAGGAIMFTQFTGLPVAVATHGISVGVGAGIGATLGLFGALKRKGHVADIRPGMPFKLETAETISMPGFKKSLLPSAKKTPYLSKFDVEVEKFKFKKNHLGDRSSKVLTVDLLVHNRTEKHFTFGDLAVISDFDKMSFQPPDIFMISNMHKIEPNEFQQGTVSFLVDGKAHKYWVVLLDHFNHSELSRYPIY